MQIYYFYSSEDSPNKFCIQAIFKPGESESASIFFLIHEWIIYLISNNVLTSARNTEIKFYLTCAEFCYD
jgi:hypothetical protein